MSYLDGLNPQQLEAAKHVNGPILVLAGAGSGKTRVLTRRVVNLVLEHNVPPEAILAVTFTNKATDEMKERLRSLLGSRASRLWVATFHSAALRILRRHAKRLGFTNDFVIYDTQDTKALMKQLLKEMSIDEKKFPAGNFLRAIDQAKNSFILPDDFSKIRKDFVGILQREVYEKYQARLRSSDAMDFGDLLLNATMLLQKFPEILEAYRYQFQYILVDEFQDTNEVQYTFIKLLAAPQYNLLVVGDDDQSIYAFRGATIANILNFERDFPKSKVVKLEQNYRSTQNILELAHAVISENKGRKGKKLWTDQGAGEKIVTYLGRDENSEAVFIAKEIAKFSRAGRPLKDIAVFYRTNAQSRAIEEALLDSGISYRIYGGLKFYDRKEVKDILGYLRLLLSDVDDQAFLRVINTPPRGIGLQTVQNICLYAAQNKISYLAAARLAAAKNTNVKSFVELITSFRDLATQLPLGGLIAKIIEKSEYGPRLKTITDPMAESRIENLLELEAIGRSTEKSSETPIIALREFLDRVSLSSSADIPAGDGSVAAQNPKDGQAVSLMTLHLSKGLEFPIVFFTGLEDGIIPHQRSIGEVDGIEEERRLCYVGITRAMEFLFLSRARQRGMRASGGDGLYGGFSMGSRFIAAMPEELLEQRGGDFLRGSFDNMADENEGVDFQF